MLATNYQQLQSTSNQLHNITESAQHSSKFRNYQPEFHKQKLFNQKEKLVKDFLKQHIYTIQGNQNTLNLLFIQGTLKANICQKKYKENSAYAGHLSQEGMKEGIGIYYYCNGDIYFGAWKNDTFHGKGVYIFAIGERYEGLEKNNQNNYNNFKESQKKDQNMDMGNFIIQIGINIKVNERRIKKMAEGFISIVPLMKSIMGNEKFFYFQKQLIILFNKDGERHGLGLYEFKLGDRYEGFWKSGKKEGRGVLQFTSGAKYDGLFSQDYQNGNGIMYYANGDRYDGDWQNGMRNGKGTLFTSTGIYTGMFQNDMKQGQGVIENQEFFIEGMFSNDHQNGQGIRVNRINGERYEGNWKDGQEHGVGKLIMPDGEQYQGEWQYGEKEGRGVYLFRNGDRYEGGWRKGEREGEGRYVWARGGEYVGGWRKGKMNGQGAFIQADGRVVKGVFVDDQIMNQSQELQQKSRIFNSRFV